MFNKVWDKNFDESFFGSSNSPQEDPYHLERERGMLDRINEMYQNANLEYRKSLLHPELHQGAKIPSEIPNETATAQIKYNGTITPNASGRFIFVVDPSIQSGSVYNGATVDGVGTGGSATTVSFLQDDNIIDMFRLVSSSLVIQYTGRLDSHSGFICGAITSNLSNATNNTFFTFTNIEDIQNKKVVVPVDGLKLIYSPYDTSQLDYYKQSDYAGATAPQRWKKLFIIYGEGLPNTACIRWDYTRNIEYVSKPSYREYVTHMSSPPCKLDSSVFTDVKSKEVQPYDNKAAAQAAPVVWGLTPPQTSMPNLLGSLATDLFKSKEVQDVIKDQLKAGIRGFGGYK